MRNGALHIRLGRICALVLMTTVSAACQQTGPLQPPVTADTEANGSAATALITKVKIEPSAVTIESRGEASISILVESAVDLAGAEIHLAFDPNVLEVIDADGEEAGDQIAHGDLLFADLIGQNRADNAAGTIDYGVAQLQRASVTGSGVLATIRFRGKALGSSAITFRSIEAAPSGANLSDSKAAPIEHELQEGSVMVE